MRLSLRPALSTAVSLSLLLAACAPDDGADVRTIGEEDGASASASGAGSSSASASGVVSGDVSGDLGDYVPVSDVGSHARVTLDVCDVAEALPGDGPMDYDAVAAVYADGANSTSGDGLRTLAGFATAERDEPLWNLYVDRFGAAWIHEQVTAAIEGTGIFADASDGVRRQVIAKGVQNQALVAWAFHEIDAARDAIAAGEIDPLEGAPHKIDEVWAFYHGAAPGCSPYATAESRAADFGTEPIANDLALAGTEAMQAAAIAGDLDTFEEGVDLFVDGVTLTYLQAATKYAQKMTSDLEGDDLDAARVHQAEGWAFFRVIEPLVAEVDADVADTVAAVFDPATEPTADAGPTVTDALATVVEPLGLTAEQVGEFQG